MFAGTSSDYAVSRGQYQIKGTDKAPMADTTRVSLEINPISDDAGTKYVQIVEKFGDKVVTSKSAGKERKAEDEEKDALDRCIATVDRATAVQALEEVEAEIERRKTGKPALTSSSSRSWWDLLGLPWLTVLLSNLSNYSLDTLEATRVSLSKKAYG